MSNSFATPFTVPARLLCPWDFPDKNTGVGCHFLLQRSSRCRDPTHVSFIGIGRQFLVFFFSVHCCHTSFVKPWAQPRHHTAHGKAQVVIACSSPAQPLPCPCRRSSAMSRPCPYPHGWRTGLGLLLCPLQRGSLATPRHLSSQRRSQRVQNQHHPGKSSPQTLVSAPWLHFLSTQCGCQSCPLPPTRWPQVKQSGQLRLRDHTAGMDGRGRGGQRSKAWWQEAEQPVSERPQAGQHTPGCNRGRGQHSESNSPGLVWPRRPGGWGQPPGPGACTQSRQSSDGSEFNGRASCSPCTWESAALQVGQG